MALPENPAVLPSARIIHLERATTRANRAEQDADATVLASPDDATVTVGLDETASLAVAAGGDTMRPRRARRTGRPRRLSPFLGGIAAELVTAGLLTERRAVAIGLQARETGETFLRVFAHDAPAAEADPVYQFLATRCGTDLIRRKGDLLDSVIDAPWLPTALAEQRGVLLLKPTTPGDAPYATLDPYDLFTRDWISRCSKARAVPFPVLPEVFQDALSRIRARSTIAEDEKTLVPIEITWQETQEIRERLATCEIPLIVDFIVHCSYEQGASDIHIEPVEDATIVRTRIDGILHEECRMPVALHPAITSRIKVLANMDVAERRRPQDGRITAQLRRQPLDIRVSSFPTVLGEKIVMRLLDEKALRPTPEQLGLRDSSLRLLLDKISAPHGLVMLSGPTGSGKTTTLYSCLSAIDRTRRNVLTIEDPVEYRLKGVHQMQVNERIGLTFANGLRNILRQDPDVIMVGECRDVETAKMAIQASLTGHVVFSTIHANDAVGVISRLLDMKIDPFLVATALSLPIAQRLVRTICQKCRSTIDGREMMTILHAEGISEEKLSRLGITIDPREPCWHGAGCTHCRHTGYVGRRAVFEMFEMTEELRDLVISPQFAADQLQRALRERGAPNMVDDAMQLVEEGLTSYVEVARVLGDGV